MFSIRFNYQESEYKALIRVVKDRDNKKEYRITVMNGELEVLLHGYHLLKEEDGKLDLSNNGIPQHVAELRTIIAEAFETFQSEDISSAN